MDSINGAPGFAPSFATSAAEELAQLEALIAQMRAKLAALQKDIADAESRLASTDSARLLEANEQLLLAALRSRADADTAAQALEEATRSGQLDALTGLPNRAVLLDRLNRSLVNARRHNARLALLFLDLNEFKQVNDALGHAVGDQVLQTVSQRLVSCVRDADTVSRHGGDEFVILLAEVARASDAAHVAEKVLAALAAPNRVGDHLLRLTASIGISIYPEDGNDAGKLIDNADAAMYRAKSRGAGSFVFGGEGAAAESQGGPPTLPSLRRPLTLHDAALAEHERRLSELQEANEHLVLAALTAQDVRAAAEQSQRRQTEFLATLGHELRNPLAPIRLAAATLGHLGSGEPLLAKVQAVLERQVVAMSRLVDDLLDVSRVSTGKLRLERERVDVTAVADAAVDACRPAMDTRLQRFSVDLPPDRLEVLGDRDRLVQVVVNLLNNASKYTPAAGEIELSVRSTGDAVTLTVSDTGIGISAEGLSRIFEPFVQDSHAIGFNGGGLGIGLTVVRELVEAHGGTVEASSGGNGLGSRFVVTLPLLASAASRSDVR